MASTFSYPQRYAQAQSIVKALYQDLLLRPVDSSGLRAWSVMLAVSSGQPALVASLTRSREYVQLRVRQAYNQVLGRAPDSAGLAAWTREILAGRIPVDDVQRRFYASGEFVNRSGGTANGYVAGLYQTILGRAASQAEVDSLAPQVGNQAGRSKVTESIWFSMEAAKYRAGKYYLLFLKRTADPAGQTGWARVLLAQGGGRGSRRHRWERGIPASWRSSAPPDDERRLADPLSADWSAPRSRRVAAWSLRQRRARRQAGPQVNEPGLAAVGLHRK